MRYWATPNCATLGRSDLLWPTLTYSGLLWATLGYSGLLWATLDYFNWFMDFGLRMTQGYQLDHSLSQRLFQNFHLTHWTLGLINVIFLAFQTHNTFFYNVLLELGGLPHVLPLAVLLEWLGTPSWHSGVLRAFIWTMELGLGLVNNLTLCDSLRSGESSRARRQTRHQRIRLRRKTLLNIFTAFDVCLNIIFFLILTSINNLPFIRLHFVDIK